MTLHDFFLGGSALRVVIFSVGIGYCVKHGHARSLTTLTQIGSIAVLVLIVFSREWATLIGVPVSMLIVERLTALVESQRENARLKGFVEDQHAINEQLLAQLIKQHTPRP
jgi:L-cystine uptake protein TcyP (sodium:dicarboxylate symporter family)